MPDRGPATIDAGGQRGRWAISAAKALAAAVTLAASLVLPACRRADSDTRQPKDAGESVTTSAASETRDTSAAGEAVTFSEHIAPIVHEHCVACHREGDAAPFPLVTYDDVRAHARQIAQVTADRFMPPWLPDPAAVKYRGERVLSDAQIELFRRWADQDAPIGDAAAAPAVSRPGGRWHLGEPELVVTMSETFEMPASGPDVYRNFVIPIPLDRPVWVKGLELDPGNRRIVHHAFMLLDPTRTIRDVDAEDPLPGFEGMETGIAQSPSGEFISWQPGRLPRFVEPGMSWRLNPGTDFVLQVHMQPSGKPEQLRASIGIHFTDERPTKFPLKICLESTEIDIPAGESNYSFQNSFVLPVAVDVLAVSPHAHYLGKRMHAWAELPDGQRKWLLKIDDWDLNWQGDYVLEPAMRLPAGTRLVQEFSYDNSEGNVRNPFHPPRRTTYGQQATDEMGSLWIQLLPDNIEDYQTLYRAMAAATLERVVVRLKKTLSENPNDAKALVDLGKIAVGSGQLDEGRRLFDQAMRADPQSALALYHAGNVRLRQGKWDEGVGLLRQALDQQPRMFNAHHDLGLAAMQRHDWAIAARHFENALAINPYHATGLRNLAAAAIEMGRYGQARDVLRRAVDANPTDEGLATLLKQVESRIGP